MRRGIRREWIIFILINAGFILGALLLMPYRALADGILKPISFCSVHDIFKVYCPSCGTTRALDSILHLRFATAAVQNPCVLLFVLLVAWFDLRAFISLIRGEERVWHAKMWQLYVFIGILFVYSVIRNVLLIGYGIDPLGDFPQYARAIGV